MTDITDQDRRVAYEWAASIEPEMDCLSASTRAVARVILATVDAPSPTLAEELRDMLEARDSGEPTSFSGLLARAAQMEHDLAEARAEGERLTAVAEDYARRATAALTERDDARAEAKTWREQDENDCEAYMEELASVREALAVEGRRVEKIAGERDHFLREVENVRNWKEQLINERDESRAEVGRLTADLKVALDKVDRLTAERNRIATGRYVTYSEVDGSLPMPPGDIPGTALPINISAIVPDPTAPNPADVKPGEAWLVEVEGERRTALKDGDRYVSWNTVDTEGCPVAEANNSVTLITRLVPAPRTVRYEPKEK